MFLAYGGLSWFGWGGLIALELDVIDYSFFALAIALKSYFQKIADPTDTAPTAAVALTINDIAAVFLPAGLGYLWLISPSAVVTLAACMALASRGLFAADPATSDAGARDDFSRARAEPDI